MLIKGAFWIGLTWLCLGYAFQPDGAPDRAIDARALGDSTRQSILSRLQELKAELKEAEKHSTAAVRPAKR